MEETLEIVEIFGGNMKRAGYIEGQRNNKQVGSNILSSLSETPDL